MTRLLLAGAAALGMMTGAAMAQSSSGLTTTTEDTTTVTPAYQAPTTTSSSATNGTAVRPDGDQTATVGSSSTDSDGNRTETTITNTSYPLTGMITSTRKTTRIVGSVATETVTITNTYPPSAMGAPQVTTSTRTYIVGTK
jgi:hypothetical protein